MGTNSTKAFTTDKLKKLEASGQPSGLRDRDSDSLADDYGRKSAKTSDSSSFAEGGAAKAPPLGRAGRASGGRIARQTGGPIKTRDINKVTDAGPWHYGDSPVIRKTGGRVAKACGGGVEEREDRARGGRTKGKGKTVVNVIVGGHGQQQPPPGPPPMAAAGPIPPPGGPPPMPPPRPPMMPPGGMPGAAGPPGPPGPPGGPMPPPMPRATGGRVNEKFGAGSGRGRLEKTRREGHGRTELPA